MGIEREGVRRWHHTAQRRRHKGRLEPLIPLRCLGIGVPEGVAAAIVIGLVPGGLEGDDRIRDHVEWCSLAHLPGAGVGLFGAGEGQLGIGEANCPASLASRPDLSSGDDAGDRRQEFFGDEAEGRTSGFEEVSAAVGLGGLH